MAYEGVKQKRDRNENKIRGGGKELEMVYLKRGFNRGRED